jgi:hypothetical protein
VIACSARSRNTLLRLLCGAAEPEESDAKQDKVFDGDSAIL